MAQSRYARVEDDAEDTDMGIGMTLDQVPLDRSHYVSSGTDAAPERVDAVLAQLERKKLAATMAVPTGDDRVRIRLRELGEPITLFGEGLVERRERLREFLTQMVKGGQEVDDDIQMDEADEQINPDEVNEYYTQGSPELLEARQEMAKYSVPKSKQRLAFQKAEASIMLRIHVAQRRDIKKRLAMFDVYGSQNADERPLGKLKFSPDGTQIAVGTWSGTVKLLSVPNLDHSLMLRGHTSAVTGLAWYPVQSTSSSTIKLATGGGEGNIHLWNLEQDTPTATLGGTARIAGLAFHPMGRYLASASYDTTWSLWDIERETKLFEQPGHSREVHAIAINGDGSLIATGGIDSIGRIWDLRTGRSVMYINRHIERINALDWSPDSHRILSGSTDGFVKCWDVRTSKEIASIGANSGGVTDVHWFKGTDGPAHKHLPDQDDLDRYLPKKSGTFIVTGGFDKEIKIFSADDWVLCKTLQGHSNNVNGVDVSFDSKWIASSGLDRTVKLWGIDDGQGAFEVN